MLLVQRVAVAALMAAPSVVTVQHYGRGSLDFRQRVLDLLSDHLDVVSIS